MFHTSSQKQHWIFPSVEDLDRHRGEAHEAARTAAVELMGEQDETITPAEQADLVRHFTRKLQELAGLFKPTLPKDVIATAVAYFKRYYVHCSVLNHPPSKIVHLCLFLACKAEENNTGNMSTFTKILGADESAFIRKFEAHVLEVLKFHVVTHHPFRPLKGFFLDMNAKLGVADALPDELRTRTDKLLVDWVCTDAPLLYPPSQIALAALHSLMTAEQKAALERYLVTVGSEEKRRELMVKIGSIQAIVSAVQAGPDPEQIRSLNGKLSRCRNPLFDPTSETFKKRKAEVEDEQEIKRQAKNARWKLEQDAQMAAITGQRV